MNTAIQCIILLACITICTSGVIRTSCQCVKTSKYVHLHRITGVMMYEPRPYCNKQEIIVILKDRSSQCLDPKERFVQAIVQTLQMQKKLRAAKTNTTIPKTTPTMLPTTAEPTPT